MRTHVALDQPVETIGIRSHRPLCPADADLEQHRGWIDFFHMDALSLAVAMKVNCDLQLTLMASSLTGYCVRVAKLRDRQSRHLFRT